MSVARISRCVSDSLRLETLSVVQAADAAVACEEMPTQKSSSEHHRQKSSSEMRMSLEWVCVCVWVGGGGGNSECGIWREKEVETWVYTNGCTQMGVQKWVYRNKWVYINGKSGERSFVCVGL